MKDSGGEASFQERLRPGSMCQSGESLHESPEKPLCEALKVKPELQWGLQDVRDAIARIKRMVPAQERDVCLRQQSWSGRAI